MKKYYPEGARADIEAVEKDFQARRSSKTPFCQENRLRRARFSATADTISMWI